MAVMELRHLRYFVAVAEKLSFTAAAEALGVAQPPLSQQIRDLETEIGTCLLERTTRRVSLTQAGQDFLVRAKAILHSAQGRHRAGACHRLRQRRRAQRRPDGLHARRTARRTDL